MDYNSIANLHPSLKRGRVWCKECGHTIKVDVVYCLKYGWPSHCGYTMTIDSPEEQEARDEKVIGGLPGMRDPELRYKEV